MHGRVKCQHFLVICEFNMTDDDIEYKLLIKVCVFLFY